MDILLIGLSSDEIRMWMNQFCSFLLGINLLKDFMNCIMY